MNVALLTSLGVQGVQAEDLEDLESAIDGDGSPPKGSLGPQVRAWVTKMLGKALDGSWRVAVDTAAVLLPEALKRYYG